jgi:hypothetical protein
MIDPGITLATASFILGGVVWAVRLEGRVNLLQAKYEDIDNRLERIEDKLDQIISSRA